VNKWQIICPLAPIVIAVVVFARVWSLNHYRYYVSAQTRMIGEELIATTNSTRLLKIGPGLKQRMSEFMAVPPGIAEIMHGDERSPIGDGTACSRLILSNATGGRLGIRLRQDSKPERFHVLGFWTIAEPSRAAAQLPESLMDENLSFKLPDHWHLQRQFTNGAASVLQLLIPDPDTDDTPDSSNAFVTAEPVQPGATVESFGDNKLRSGLPFTVITNIPAGHTWRTVLSRGKQGNTPYIVLDRFGVDAGYMVALRVAFPVIQRKDGRWMANMVADCNNVIGSLKIRSKNVITSELKYDEDVRGVNVVWLRVLADPATRFGEFPR
jgi:hypothetical protein